MTAEGPMTRGAGYQRITPRKGDERPFTAEEVSFIIEQV
jgi:hypothetical protein